MRENDYEERDQQDQIDDLIIDTSTKKKEAPSSVTFPKKKDRKQLLQELKELEKDGNAEITGNWLYKQYQEKLAELNKAMEEISVPGEKKPDMTPDEYAKTMLPPDITAEDKEKLQNLLIETGKKGELFLGYVQSKKKSVTLVIPGVVNKLQEIMSKDYDALSQYNPEEKKTLSEVQEKARTRVVDFRNKKIKNMSHLQNSRIPMMVSNSRGEKRNGVFTKANYNHAKADFMALLEKAKEKCNDSGKAEIDNILSSYRSRLSGRTPKRTGEIMDHTATDNFLIGCLSKEMDIKVGEGKVTPTILKEYLNNRVKINAHLISADAMIILADGFDKMKNDFSIGMNNWDLEISEGERIDNRNSAMSAMAGLLGVSGLVARSENMQYIDGDGNVVEGTFMEFGKGLDLDSDDSLFKHVSDKPFKKKGQLYKQIAELQILDFLCYNADRHAGNVMYQVDQEGNVIGIQGIDNDSTFGTGKSYDMDIECLKVISSSMAKKLEGMTPEMIKFSLRGRGLPEAELEAAADRLDMLKDALEKGMVQVIEDDEFGNLNMEELMPPKGETNMFHRVDSFIKLGVRKARKEGYAFEPLIEEKEPKLKKVAATERKGTLGGVMDVLHDLSVYRVDNQTDLITKTRGSSEYFKDLVATMADTEALFKELSADKNLDERTILTEVTAKPYLKKISEKMGLLMDQATDYLEFKMKDRKAKSLDKLKGKNSYEQKHIDYAKKVIEFVETYNRHLDGPSNDRERQDAMNNYDQRNAEHIKESLKNYEKSKQAQPGGMNL